MRIRFRRNGSLSFGRGDDRRHVFVFNGGLRLGHFVRNAGVPFVFDRGRRRFGAAPVGCRQERRPERGARFVGDVTKLTYF